MLNPHHRIFVAGHRGMVGSAVCRRIASAGGVEVLTAGREVLDLLDRGATEGYLRHHRPDAVVFAAARVGGIVANQTYPVQFLADNVRMATNTIEAAYAADVGRLLFLGSTCIYPRDCPQPIVESSLLSGPLEKTNEAYALAKITGLKLCEYYRRQYGVCYTSAMPTNLYGPGDNYHPQHSHVLPALLRRLHEAQQADLPEVVIWGTGTPRREFLHVDDLAAAILHLLAIEDPPDWVNVGTGQDIQIIDLAAKIAQVVGYRGRIVTDPSRPDGTPVKCCDVALLHSLGWKHSISLDVGLQETYRAFLNERRSGELRSV